MVVSSVVAGASGGALANVALSPLGGGAGMLQSYWYGAGLILGERMMYTFHWEKMKARLDKGEDFLQVLESEMNPSITAIANYSLQIMERTGEIYLQGGIDFMARLIEKMFMLVAGETGDIPVDAPTIGDPRRTPSGELPSDPIPTPPINPQCPSGFRWSTSAQQCVPEDIPEPTSTPTPVSGKYEIIYYHSASFPKLKRSYERGQAISWIVDLMRALQGVKPYYSTAVSGEARNWRARELNAWTVTYPELVNIALPIVRS